MLALSESPSGLRINPEKECGMDIALDKFLMAVRSSLLLAQESLERRNEEKAASIRNMGQQQFLVGPFSGGQDQVLSLSEASLRGHRHHQVCMLSLTWLCRFHLEAPFSSSRGGRLCLQDVGAANRLFGKRSLARVRIVFTGTSRPEGEVWLNETLFSSLSWDQQDLNHEDGEWHAQFLFGRLWQWLFGRGRDVFFLSPEQAGRAQRILK